MSLHQSERQRRQFGRREASTHAIASVPGRASVVCEIKNVSEGGALIVFDDTYVPNRPFRLLIDGMSLNLLCEVRHQGKYGVGVRFLNPQDGVLLMRHLYPETVMQDQSTWKADAAPAGNETPVLVSNRELREGLIAAREASRQAKRPAIRPCRKTSFDDRVRMAMLATALNCATLESALVQSRVMANKTLPFYCAG